MLGRAEGGCGLIISITRKDRAATQQDWGPHSPRAFAGVATVERRSRHDLLLVFAEDAAPEVADFTDAAAGVHGGGLR